METAHVHSAKERIVLMGMVLLAFVLLATNFTPGWSLSALEGGSLTGAASASPPAESGDTTTILTLLLALIVLGVAVGLFIGMLLRRRKETSSLLHVPGKMPQPLEQHLRFRFWKGKKDNDIPFDEELQKVKKELEELPGEEYKYLQRKGTLHGFKHTTPKAQELSKPAERIFLQEELKIVEDELMHLERALPQKGKVISIAPKTRGHAEELLPRIYEND